MTENAPKRLFIRTYGCQMNVYDSARMADVLAPLGYGPAEGPEDADMVILNTCHIREKASEKVFSELGRLRAIKESRAARGAGYAIGVAGCVAQAEGAEITRRAPWVDMVLGPQNYHRLPEMVARLARAEGSGLVETDFPAEAKFDHLPEETTGQGVSAFLSVQEGCDKFCTFCVVPYTRGAEYSRPAADVLAEARRLVASGAREITLIGQNVNAYHGAGPDGGEWTLGRLIRAVAEVPGVDRIRYTTSHPNDVDASLIAAHRDVPQLMPFLHLPVQSGSDRVLQAMNRKHTADDFRRVAAELKEARPDLVLSSDFIVGFPGETGQDFQETLSLVAEIGFLNAYSFKYSPRPGTPAADHPDQVPASEMSSRLHTLQALLDEQQQSFNTATVGSVLPVLFDRPGRHAGQVVGRSPWMQAVHAELPETALGTVMDVEITGVTAHSLAARPLGDPDERSCA